MMIIKAVNAVALAHVSFETRLCQSLPQDERYLRVVAKLNSIGCVPLSALVLRRPKAVSKDTCARWIFSTLLFLIAALTAPLSAITPQVDDQAFIQSFLKHYEFTPEGRYVHEYHPFILTETAKSFLRLEQHLASRGFNLAGRNVILGYEEQAVPSYYTDFRQKKINDEASVKGNVGWSLKLHNRFGFMTGFLFKDIVDKTVTSVIDGHTVHFEHINANRIPLFDDRASIFQEHAFGQAFELIFNTRAQVIDAVRDGDTDLLFKRLVNFWEYLYTGSLKVGNNQIAGTQDILFSIQYAKYHRQSQIPLFNYFIGPDVTYPIEVFEKQDAEVTRNAQAFVKRFVRVLKPLNNEPTVYIFCSFVDGVGKSTMLGNIKNWMRFGSDTAKFCHVDNSSSQLAEMFKFADNVYIADLPAQISHFTYKPDGLVFVDARTEMVAAELSDLYSHIDQNIAAIKADYGCNVAKVQQIIASEGYFAAQLCTPERADLAYLKNLVLLKKVQDNVWLPFRYNDRWFLANARDCNECRMLMPLADVRSEGLKNIESDQMLFFSGVRFPLPYQSFLDDLAGKLKTNNIKNAVFVDFLSMYPRSSRENVRVNYVLQQLALLDAGFDVSHSVYRNFVSGGELLYYMMSKQSGAKILQAFKFEALVRLVLYKQIVARETGDLTGYSLQEVTRQLEHEIKNTPNDIKQMLHQDAHKKYTQELGLLEKLYGQSKSFVNVQLFGAPKMLELSRILHEVFTEQLDFEAMNYLWQKPGILIIPQDHKQHEQGHVDFNAMTDQQQLYKVLYKMHPACRYEAILAPFVRALRASWYISLLNLCQAVPADSGRFAMDRFIFPILPALVAEGSDGYLYLVQQPAEPWEEKIPTYFKQLYDVFGIKVTNKKSIVKFAEIAFWADWKAIMTNNEFFAFDAALVKTATSPLYDSAVTKVVRKEQKEASVSVVTPTTRLIDLLDKNYSWESETASLNRRRADEVYTTPEAPSGLFLEQPTKKNATYADLVKLRPNHRIKKIITARPEQAEIMRLLMRLLATVEMVVKDPDADVVVRDNNQEDFAQAVNLAEGFLFPKYLGLAFNPMLFETDREIEPYPSWNHWREILADYEG